MKERIFIIDDDIFFIGMLGYQIAKHGDIVVKSFNKAEACFNYLEEKPIIVFMDYDLSSYGKNNMDGIQAIKRIKREDQEMIVIMLSGSTDEVLKQKAMDAGANHFFTKTQTIYNDLSELIGHYLGLHKHAS